MGIGDTVFVFIAVGALSLTEIIAQILGAIL
jgi:hypothetical protein